MPKVTHDLPPVFSFMRYSNAAQSAGDSNRRQRDAALAWCKKNGRTLDRTLAHTGSAYKGDQRKAGSPLAQFLADVEAGDIAPGSVLLLESMDRLLREKPVRAVHYLTGILLAGIRVVQLMPDELELTEDSDLFSLLRGQLAQERGHHESQTKSSRVGEAWSMKKGKRRKQGTVETSRVPAWIEVVGRTRVGKHMTGGTFVLDERKAGVIKNIFEWCISGMGASLIVKRLTDEADPVEPISPLRSRAVLNPKTREPMKDADDREVRELYRPPWSKAYIRKILAGREVLGEFQPKANGKASGEAVVDFFPRVIDEATWDKAQAATEGRNDRGGPVGVRLGSLFGGLLHDAATRSKMVVSMSMTGKVKGERAKRRILRSADSMDGRAPTVSFDYDTFEREILSQLREVTVAEVTGSQKQNEAAKLGEERAALGVKIKRVEAELATDPDADIPSVIRVLKSMNAQMDDLARREKEAKRLDPDSTADAWGEARGLLDVAGDERYRVRLRQLLRASISGMWLLIVPKGDRRILVAQAHFTSGLVRHWLIVSRRANRCYGAVSYAAPSLLVEQLAGADLDLRRKDHTKRLTKALESLDAGSLPFTATSPAAAAIDARIAATMTGQ